ncbi:DUF2782 domain-containing protein [Massilia sp. Dwa41.01b]|uniref:DUF2782 domain-containing protein n=1 Tax=Massilia sp. Dwa41.01b TaxID=2709302 RepID=UPI001E43D46F|nr:DUF2782 domain-containing protein [Massilia sp. Dwa41.01b]
MLRTFPRLSLLTIALLAGAGTAAAQTGNPTTATPATAGAQQAGQPPGTEPIERGSDEPATRIEPRRGTQIKEKRNNGQVTEVEVRSGKSHYIMRPNQAAGNAQAGDAQSSAFRAPQWQVMEFDLNAKKKPRPMPTRRPLRQARRRLARLRPAHRRPRAPRPAAHPPARCRRPPCR